jgi:hypothetical protein
MGKIFQEEKNEREDLLFEKVDSESDQSQCGLNIDWLS